MRSALGLDLEERQKVSTWDKTLRRLIDHPDALGILVMVNGVVGNNSYRRLDPQEFCGFALSDARASLVFINGADAKTAQMFHAGAHARPYLAQPIRAIRCHADRGYRAGGRARINSGRWMGPVFPISTTGANFVARIALAIDRAHLWPQCRNRFAVHLLEQSNDIGNSGLAKHYSVTRTFPEENSLG
jgi:hypothetical protein